VRRLWSTLLLLPLLAACGEETPTGVGAGLLPSETIRTFEVLLEPERFLVWDTTFGKYTEPQDAEFLVVARDFDDALDARGLARFHIPQVVQVLDSLGVLRQDSAPAYVGGTLRMVLDSVRSTEQPVQLGLYRTAQEWHPSATWTHSVDTLGTRIAWTQAGGTRSERVDTATYEVGSDTLVFQLDAATATEWADTLFAGRGALVVMETSGGRVFAGVPWLEVQVRSSMNPDTTYVVDAALAGKTFIFSPEQPAIAQDLRVGGTPGWRSMFRFRERLDTLSVACPGVPNCSIRLGDATINHAALQLQPSQTPSGMGPEEDLSVGAYLVLPSAQVPLARSPLGDAISAVPVPRTSFMAPDSPVVEVGITEFMQANALPPTDDATFTPRHLALVQFQQRTFGFGSFASLPRLRLILSIATELHLP
jgi:hypothetical protein